MATSLYGERYIESKHFVVYCRSTRAYSNLTSRDLELYEKEGLLLPVARIVKPREYMHLRQGQFDPGGNPGAPIPGWEKLETLLYGSNHDGLWHKFDVEFDRQNKYLINPSKTEFQPWDTYHVDLRSSSGENYSNGDATHYYHYWQIYQVYEIQNKFPIFSKHHFLYEVLKGKIPEYWIENLHPGTPNNLANLYGYYPRFDALSCFTTLYANEQVKTFLLPNGKIRSLNEEEIEEYRARQITHARTTIDQFSLGNEIDSLYELLVYLLELQSHFQEQEKMQLVKETEKDLISVVRFIYFLTGQKFEDINQTLKLRISRGMQLQFRHLDKSLLVKDETQEVFEYLIKGYNTLFPNSKLSDQGLNQLVDFLFSQPLFIFPHAIYDIQENLNNSKQFPRTSSYINLGNLSVGLESFLRVLSNGKNLKDLIENLYKKDLTEKSLWLDQFTKYVSKYGGTGTVTRLYDVITNPHLHEVARIFLVSYYARNFVMHSYTEDNEFYEEIFSKVYTSICYGLFYTWHFALNQGLI